MDVIGEINQMAQILDAIAAPLIWKMLPIVLCIVFVIPFIGIEGLGRLYGFILLGIVPVTLFSLTVGLSKYSGWWIAFLWIISIWGMCLALTIRNAKSNRQTKNNRDNKTEAIRIVERLRKVK